ncbi:MAG: type II toxin-antitoxin system HicA family toxin [Desulfobulbaceae bacterium]|nr:type II toxin-antitoxin system HicA family toxin [Desulfobulbaceae bacterium]
MSKIEKIIRKMTENPRDWRIGNLENIAEHYQLNIRKSGGSHVGFGHKNSNIVVTVPAHKPIKPVYIKQFLILVEAVIKG